tara:strand:+ start:279 stop:524 length:246 start_codon:yes stop_codon:yes gene_type:complete
MSTKQEAANRIEEILCEVDELGSEAHTLMRKHFKSQATKGDAYGVFTIGHSHNRFDTTLATLFDEISNEEEYDEEEYEEEA